MNTATATNPEATAAVVAALANRKYDTVIDFRAMDAGSLVPIENEKRGEISRPTPNTMTGIVWQIADYIYNERNAINAANQNVEGFKPLLPVPLISEVLEIFEAKVKGAKGPTARQQLGYWVKFYGMEAMRDERVKSEGSAEDEAKKAAKAEKDRLKAEKQAEKERLAAEKAAKEIEKLAADEGKMKAEIDKANARLAALNAKQKAIDEAKAAQAAKAAADAKEAAKAAKNA